MIQRRWLSNQPRRTRRIPYLAPALGISALLAPSLSAQYDQLGSTITESNGYMASAASGDFNGDGIDELAVGCPWGSPSKVRIFWNAGQTEQDLPNPGTNARFGASVAAGDVNGDGREDLVVGAPNGMNGKVYVYYLYDSYVKTDVFHVPNSLPGVTNANGWGAAVSITPDINGNGYAEIVVGAPNALDPYGVQRGFVTILDGHHGASQTVLRNYSPAQGMHLYGVSRFGLDVEGGDFDGDGIGDVAVYWLSLTWVVDAGGGIPGTPFEQEPEDQPEPLPSGSPPIYHRHVISVFALQPGFSWATRYDQKELGPYQGGGAGGHPYEDMANAGDFNFDNADDLIVGDAGFHDRDGRTLLWLPAYYSPNPPIVFPVNGLTGAMRENGAAVAALGDLDGDGRADGITLSEESVDSLAAGDYPSGSATWKMGVPMGTLSNHGAGWTLQPRLEGGDFNGDGWRDFAWIETTTTSTLKFFSIASTTDPLSTPLIEAPTNGGCAPLFLRGTTANPGDIAFLLVSTNPGSGTNPITDPCGSGMYLPFDPNDTFVSMTLNDPTALVAVNYVRFPTSRQLLSRMDIQQPGFGSYAGVGIGFYSFDFFSGCWTGVSNVAVVKTQ